MDLETIRKFTFQRILSEDPKNKFLAILGEIQDQPAVIIAEKTAFDNPTVSELFQPNLTPDVTLTERNDVYHSYTATIAQDIAKPGIKATLIWPATQTHIRKYSKQARRMIRETPELYQQITLPYITSQLGPRIQWVYNILNHTAETDRIVYEDTDPNTGFILLPDLKWDRVTLSSFYLMALVNRRDLHSLHDLNTTHLPLLKNIRSSALREIPLQWPTVSPDQLRLYIHYQPSYYHFHVHVTHLEYEGGDGMAVGRAWLLDDVIAQLEEMAEGRGFEGRTITYVLGEESGLWKEGFSNVKG
ncbi:scavenger mRNA-decapping enzyme DcpS [Saitoella complicata NRRL Y-17804]|uniref:m7GpppX diphosphatase n=1 Tax=Saitoella complicata (strain BCRC 22490 / CBS 7301 / JCM 7358 / NBRC 10748 / NRRL Y-17804) TaxID=698492 RepID=A0A0E9NMC5_SAICN|nr:scavenger mRNA-decapping enzyme DcpS [Saitoella complicata NRRL Y-17804]ODQ53974.1 scavenger mRNA-decapping enzyme DcpS [Saitoella complicata NRRL Y-17804]GAO50989.1 hypothetical protein G7K_5102-t1 [Saitoella complicata NRRL Y-17804]